jgi:hypothetical protein
LTTAAAALASPHLSRPIAAAAEGRDGATPVQGDGGLQYDAGSRSLAPR